MTRYIIRPQGINKTPRLLKAALNATRTLRYPFVGLRRPDRLRDFFLVYPPAEQLENFNALTQTQRENYQRIREFCGSNKAIQRGLIEALSFPIPETYTSTNTELPPGVYIARPLRHSSGRGYRLIRGVPTNTTTTEVSQYSIQEYEPSTSWDPSCEYLQEFYPKNHEYRVLVSRGIPIITLLKRVPESLSNEAPWNHSQGSSFVTVNNIENNRLRHTDIYDLIGNNSFFHGVDLCGIDVMMSRNHEKPYVITEFNFCPSITIPDNLTRIANHVQGSVLR